MDSLTQVVLGAAVGAVIGGRRHGRKAALTGAIFGLLPDLDVLIPYGDDVSNVTYHRGFSHSLIVAVAATPVFAAVLSRVSWFGMRFKDMTVHAMIFAALVTHALLDTLTIYGTQIFWPLTVPPAGTGSVFIIDPVYTLTLLAGLIAFLARRAMAPLQWGLLFSTLYLIWGLGAQAYVTHTVRAQMPAVEAKRILVQTTPFNTFLWRILIREEGGYKVGYVSLFDRDKSVTFKHFASTPALLAPIDDSVAVRRLQWFSKGFYITEETSDGLVLIRDIRMGLEPDQYVFSYVVGRRDADGTIVAVKTPYLLRGARDLRRLDAVWARIWDEDVRM